MKKKKVYSLIDKYKSGNVTEDERKELFDWYRTVANEESEFPEDEHIVEQYMLNRLLTDTKVVGKRNNYSYWIAAASIFIVVGLGIFYFSNNDTKLNPTQMAKKSAIKPGKNQAVLVLADGSEVSLSDANLSSIPGQSGIQISKTAGGQIVYTVLPQLPRADGLVDTTTYYNTIRTPAGGQFKIVLSDGTQVWLNAMSSLKFPVGFAANKDRAVSLVGEGYFEVRRNEQSPFRVSTAKQTIEVLGTHFNVDAYPGESSTKTTLLEGSVRIASEDHSVKLRPGQEAVLKDKFTVNSVQAENAVAWKNGFFRYEGEKLENIMKVMSRWYNVEVVYEDESLKNESFGVLSDRFGDISILLHNLELTGQVKLRIKGSIVYVNSK